MTEPKWLTREAIEIMHHEQLGEHGGLAGLKDENALEAALARPLHKAARLAKMIFSFWLPHTSTG